MLSRTLGSSISTRRRCMNSSLNQRTSLPSSSLLSLTSMRDAKKRCSLVNTSRQPSLRFFDIFNLSWAALPKQASNVVFLLACSAKLSAAAVNSMVFLNDLRILGSCKCADGWLPPTTNNTSFSDSPLSSSILFFTRARMTRVPSASRLHNSSSTLMYPASTHFMKAFFSISFPAVVATGNLYFSVKFALVSNLHTASHNRSKCSFLKSGLCPRMTQISFSSIVALLVVLVEIKQASTHKVVVDGFPFANNSLCTSFVVRFPLYSLPSAQGNFPTMMWTSGVCFGTAWPDTMSTSPSLPFLMTSW